MIKTLEAKSLKTIVDACIFVISLVMFCITTTRNWAAQFIKNLSPCRGFGPVSYIKLYLNMIDAMIKKSGHFSHLVAPRAFKNDRTILRWGHFKPQAVRCRKTTIGAGYFKPYVVRCRKTTIPIELGLLTAQESHMWGLCPLPKTAASIFSFVSICFSQRPQEGSESPAEVNTEIS